MSPRQLRPVCSTLLFAVLAVVPLLAQDAFEQEPIQYSVAEPDDAVSRLQERIEAGDTELTWDEQHGYLDSLLGELDVPRSSQSLVFSKTSFQASRISPSAPRAVYFNDDVYVGSVRRSHTLELSVANSKLGTTFYTVEREEGRPRFERQTHQCLQCHASTHTKQIPGHMVRSVYPDKDGTPFYQAGTFRTDHTSPFPQRWGGWYVTGAHGSQRHMGNVVVQDADQPDQLDVEAGANVQDLSNHFDTSAYLTAHSDVVALMVLEHQVQMHNLLTAANFETRRALHHQAVMNKLFKEPDDYQSETTKSRIRNSCRRLVEYMLFAGETPLTDQVTGSSGFAREFAERGPIDERGRSLRQFDLKHRLFKYPCSYLIYSSSFDELPPTALDQVYRQLYDALAQDDANDRFAHLTPADRTAIREIVAATKDNLPDYWQ